MKKTIADHCVKLFENQYVIVLGMDDGNVQIVQKLPPGNLAFAPDGVYEYKLVTDTPEYVGRQPDRFPFQETVQLVNVGVGPGNQVIRVGQAEFTGRWVVSGPNEQ